MKIDLPIPEGIQEQLRWYLKKARKNIYQHVPSAQIVRSKSKKDGGFDAFSAYFIQKQGEIAPTRHPRILKKLLDTACGLRFIIKSYGVDLGSGSMTFNDFEQEANANGFPHWLKMEILEAKREYSYDT